jgi:S1-C subfamily serine protease
MNLLDLAIIVALISAVGWGLSTGVAVQMGAYIGLALGLVAGAWAAPRVAGLSDDPPTKATITLFCVFGVGLLLALGGERLGAIASTALRRARLGPVDTVLGGVVAAFAQVVIVWLLAASLASAPLGGLGHLIQSSKVIGEIDRLMPPVPATMSRLGRLVDPLGFPRVFAGLEPSPSAPVAPPSPAMTDGVTAAAQASTVKIEGKGCGGIVDGSGFVVAPDLVVTNAHVVAGISKPFVMHSTGSLPAVPVAFDPALDVAVLRVEGLNAPSLRLTPTKVERGRGGVVLGYPGGGDFTAVPAAVRDEFTAEGRDIYNQGLTERDVYELQASVRPGNSGGPFVLEDGSVGGVIFAQSLSDRAVSYALTSLEVQPVVDRAAAEQTPVATGGCAAG